MSRVLSLRALFNEIFDKAPSREVFAPGRLNLLGEHVDYLGGKVLPAAIHLGISILGRLDKSQSSLRIYSADYAQMWELDIKTLNPESLPNGWQRYIGGVLCWLKEQNMPPWGGQVVFGGNLPKGAGLSSSAALLVASLLFFAHGHEKAPKGKDCALAAQAIENRFVGTACGIMDQFASVFGKKDHFLELQCQSLDFRQIPLELGDCELILVDSMVSHKLGADYNSVRRDLENAQSKLGQALISLCPEKIENSTAPLTAIERARALYVAEESQRTEQFIKAAQKKDFVNMGRLMQETHWGLSKLLGVSTPELDALIEISQPLTGWLGARMMGGGFGGCVLSLVRKKDCANYTQSLSETFESRFGQKPNIYFLQTGDGARCVFSS